MPIAAKPARPKTLEAAQQQLDECWALLESLRPVLEEHELLKQQFIELKGQFDELMSQLKVSSRNSSKPPSMDSPAQKSKRPRAVKKSPRNRGAQPGHTKYERRLVPEEQVDDIHHYFPHGRCACGGSVVIESQPNYRHQVFDIPPLAMTVTEHQFYQGYCTQCHQKHRSQWPDWVPSGQMGAGLISWIGLLSGSFHLTTRQIQTLLLESFQNTFSTGAISQAQGKLTEWMEKPYQQVGDYVRQQALAQADETRHYHKHSRQAYWLWVLVSGSFCFFMTHFSRGQQAASQLLQHFSGYLVTDHYAGYNLYPAEKRQLCWAHLIRHFRRMSERRGQAGFIGKRLLLIAQVVIRTQHRFAQGTLAKTLYYRRLLRLRKTFQALLKQGIGLNPITAKRTRNQCQHLMKDEALCWTFMKDSRIPLTNNRAESALRPYVIWRKLSFATQSFRGLRFRPMILTLTTTASRLGISSWAMLRVISEQGLARKKITFQFPFQQRLP